MASCVPAVPAAETPGVPASCGVASGTVHNYINGEFIRPAAGEYVDVVNPARQCVSGRIPRSRAEDVENGGWLTVPRGGGGGGGGCKYIKCGVFVQP